MDQHAHSGAHVVLPWSLWLYSNFTSACKSFDSVLPQCWPALLHPVSQYTLLTVTRDPARTLTGMALNLRQSGEIVSMILSPQTMKMDSFFRLCQDEEVPSACFGSEHSHPWTDVGYHPCMPPTDLLRWSWTWALCVGYTISAAHHITRIFRCQTTHGSLGGLAYYVRCPHFTLQPWPHLRYPTSGPAVCQRTREAREHSRSPQVSDTYTGEVRWFLQREHSVPSLLSLSHKN